MAKRLASDIACSRDKWTSRCFVCLHSISAGCKLRRDDSFATTNGLTLQDGNNLFVTAGSNSSGTLMLSTKEARTLPVTVGFSYDLNGNLLSDGLKGYDYDDANQLVRVTVTNQWKAEFSYDGLGRRRIAKDYSWSGASWTLTYEVRYVWDGMVVLQERDGANAVKVTLASQALRI